jgi:putative transposase
MAKVGDGLRERLLAEVRRLPASRLPDLERWLRAMECGGLPPLSLDAGKESDPRPFSASGNLVGEDESGGKPPHSKDWPHAPLHRLSEHGTFIVTAGTLHKTHHFCGTDRLDLLEAALLRHMKQAGWQLEAWAVFSNHYHFVAHARAGAQDLRAVLTVLHSKTAHELNAADHVAGRQVWHNFWDTRLTFEKSYFTRLNYVHQNPVKHGRVRIANQYRWCSAAWFEHTATPAQVRTIYSFKTDRLHIQDDYEPE